MSTPIGNTDPTLAGPSRFEAQTPQDVIGRAWELYAGVTRKFDDAIPYAVHPIAVGMVVQERGGDNIAIKAALLHDVLEVVAPSRYDEDDMREEFGDAVTDIVAAITKPPQRPGDGGWWVRTQQQMRQIAASADDRTLFVFAADRLLGERALTADTIRYLKEFGAKDFWANFHGGAEGQLRKYQAGLDLLRRHRPDWPINLELESASRELEAAIINLGGDYNGANAA